MPEPGALRGAEASHPLELADAGHEVTLLEKASELGGLASALVAAVLVVESDAAAFHVETVVTILLSILIGSVTFTGSE